MSKVLFLSLTAPRDGFGMFLQQVVKVCGCHRPHVAFHFPSLASYSTQPVGGGHPGVSPGDYPESMRQKCGARLPEFTKEELKADIDRVIS